MASQFCQNVTGMWRAELLIFIQKLAPFLHRVDGQDKDQAQYQKSENHRFHVHN